MNSLSNVTIVWSVIGSAGALLGLIHFTRGIQDRGLRVDLVFSVAAFCFVGVAYTELQSMHARTPEEWAFWVRWCYVPVSGMIVALVVFVWRYFGSGRAWLAATVIGLRVLILAINLLHDPTIAFNRIDSLARIPFLGDTVSVVARAETSRWQWLGTIASILLVVYVIDAAVTLWRRGNADERRRAAIIGGAVLLYAGMGGVYVQLVLWRVTTLPLLITPTFALLVLAMAYELSRDSLHASKIARDLQESQHRLELAAAAADLGLWEWKSRTNRVWATRQAREIFGFGNAAPAGLAEWMLRIHPEDAHWIRRGTETALEQGREQVAEFRVCPPGLETRWVSAHGRAEPAEGGAGTLMRGVIRDVSDQKRAQDEALELRRELTHTGRVSLLGQLASALAHELSQPLGAILRNVEAAELILAGATPDMDELKAIVADIHRDDRRAGQVIDRLRSLLKKRRLDFQPVAVEALLQDVTLLALSDASSRKVNLKCTTEPGLPPISGDRVHLSQVLLNLIINGMDAVMEKSPAERRVAIAAKRGAGGTAEIVVSDSGAGIPDDSLPRIFDPFFTTKSAGMGIGLSISRTIVEAHGGRLTAENRAGSGAVFRISLPATQAASP